MEIKDMQNNIKEIINQIDSKLSISHNDEITLMRLTEELGELARQINNKNIRKIPLNNENMKEEIADIILLTSKIADNNNIDLEAAINSKISKLRQRHNLQQ